MTNESIQVGDISGSTGVAIGAGASVVVGYTAEQVDALLEQVSASFQPKPFTGECPYVGLDTFQEEDAGKFFGRERLVEDLLGRLANRFLMIAGPSGSGKSSLVRAGLLPELKGGALPGSSHWLYATMRPGRKPLESLGRAAAALAGNLNASEDILKRGLSDPSILHQWAEIALGDSPNRRALLFIDQFEEVFTQATDSPTWEAERNAFLELLAYAANAEGGRILLLLTMRSDFVANCAAFPHLNALLNQQFIQIGAMQPEELVSSIASPALQVGLKIDPDLIAQIINDMGNEPGVLPLMQFALKDLFDAEMAQGGVPALTRAAYLQRGGMHKALERHADTQFARLSPDQQALARNVFTHLIAVGRGTLDTRRTALWQELTPAGTDAEQVRAVVRQLADARLVTTDEQTVTLAHERLIDAWPWLRKLVDENRETIALQNQIAQDAQEWEQGQRDPSYLYTGARLAVAREQLEARKLTLSGLAQEYVQAGIQVEQVQQRSKERQRNILLAAAIGIAVVMALLGLVAWNSAVSESRQAATATFALGLSEQRGTQAAEQKSQAEQQASLARARELAAQAQNPPDNKPARGLLLAVEAVNAFQPRTPAAEQVLRDALAVIHRSHVLGGHENAIYTLAFSPDGRWLATGSSDDTVRLWNVQNPISQPVVLRGHEDHVLTLAFSPNGRWLATGSADNTARLWDMQDTAAQPIVLNGHEDRITTLAFSPDGRWLATGSADGTACLWDMQDTATQPIVLRGHEGGIYTLAFSPDGRWLATGSEDSTACLWDMQVPSSPPIVLRGHKYAISTLAFSPDGRWLATGNYDGTTRLWGVQNIESQPVVLRGHENAIYTLAFSPDGRWLATGSLLDSTICLWDVQNPDSQPVVLRGHENAIYTLAFSPNGRWLATGSADNTARLWDVQNPSSQPIVLRGHEGWIDAQAFSPDGRWLATGSTDNTARLWDVQNPSSQPIVLRGHEDHVLTLAFSPDGRWLATGSSDNTVRLWDVQNPTSQPVVLRGHEDHVLTLAFSPNGRWLATGSADNTARLWDMQDTAAQPIVLNGHEDRITTLAFSPDGRWLATGSADGTACLWDMQDTATQPIVLRGHEGWIDALAFSPDGRWLATGSEDSTACLWDMQDTESQPVVLRGHEREIRTLAFSPDGRWLATGSDDQTARLWDMQVPSSPPIVLRGGWILTLAFSPDGRWLATGSADKTVRLWLVNPDDLITLACQTAYRNLTQAEWAQYFPGEPYRKTCEQWPEGE